VNKSQTNWGQALTEDNGENATPNFMRINIIYVQETRGALRATDRVGPFGTGIRRTFM
jgi:hypothetical protein